MKAIILGEEMELSAFTVAVCGMGSQKEARRLERKFHGCTCGFRSADFKISSGFITGEITFVDYCPLPVPSQTSEATR
ncbi:MAG: hypothetical protein NT105_23795 [Verrucomicrobia bacterium]|nr:hypothetical protein [Verrucomicrobiota bacterium]